MIKSISVMQNASEVCDQLRKRFFGADALPAEFKDGYVVNAAIEAFKSDPDMLMTEQINELDKTENKMPKSINLRSACCDITASISSYLGLPESETIRRILWYSLLNNESPDVNKCSLDIEAVKTQVIELRNQLAQATAIINDILVKLNRLEDK